MAEHSAADRKAQLIAELAQARGELAQNARGLKSNLNVGSHLKHAVARQKSLWLGGAVITGWLLTKLPGRKSSKERAPKYIYAKAKEPDRKGFLLAALGLAASLLRPALTSFVTQKLAEMAERHQHRAYNSPSSPPPSGRTARPNDVHYR